MALSGLQFPISAGGHEVVIAEVGAALRSYTLGGADVTIPFGEDVLPPKCCGAVLVPWPNRLRGGNYTFDGVEQQLPLTEPATGAAIHGLGRWARWTPVAHQPSHLTLALDIVPQKGYPFEVRAEVSYALDVTTGLTVTLSAHNHGSERAPFGAGCHPYLSSRGVPLDETTVVLPAAERVLVDDAQIPVGVEPVAETPYDLRTAKSLGALRMDDGFTALSFTNGRGRAEVHGRGGGAQLWFDEAFGYLQVFTRDDLDGAGPGVAIEPMTCAADAFNSGAGLLVLEPGASWSAAWGITPI